MAGCCSVQFVVEGDGGVYPCDFYVLDEWRLGNIGETGLADMQNSETAKRFVRQSLAVPEECKTCQWFGLCRNGCRRDRDILPNAEYLLYGIQKILFRAIPSAGTID